MAVCIDSCEMFDTCLFMQSLRDFVVALVVCAGQTSVKEFTDGFE